mgnify:CR=1 FL=1
MNDFKDYLENLTRAESEELTIHFFSFCMGRIDDEKVLECLPKSTVTKRRLSIIEKISKVISIAMKVVFALIIFMIIAAFIIFKTGI